MFAFTSFFASPRFSSFDGNGLFADSSTTRLSERQLRGIEGEATGAYECRGAAEAAAVSLLGSDHKKSPQPTEVDRGQSLISQRNLCGLAKALGLSDKLVAPRQCIRRVQEVAPAKGVGVVPRAVLFAVTASKRHLMNREGLAVFGLLLFAVGGGGDAPETEDGSR